MATSGRVALDTLACKDRLALLLVTGDRGNSWTPGWEVPAARLQKVLAAILVSAHKWPPDLGPGAIIKHAGCNAEVNLDALQWMRRVASVLDRGAAITIDYGYPATDLYSRRHCDGTLLCFYRHTLNADPYARVGEQDITTHVDFTSLMAEAAQLGLQPAGLTTQREFLRALGIDGYRRRLSTLQLRRRDFDANGLAMDALVAPQGLGRIGVMIQVKGVDEFLPAGLQPDGLRPAELGRDFTLEPPPLLRAQQLRLNASPTAELSQAETEDLWRDLMAEDDML